MSHRRKGRRVSGVDFSRFHHDVAFGKAGGRIIWQPRIGCWYDDKIFAGEELPAPYTGMSPVEVYRALGVSARVYNYNKSFKRVEHPSVKVIERKLSDTDTEITTETPVGRQVEIRRQSPNSTHIIHVKWPVSSEDELKVATWRAENETWQWDQTAFDRTRAAWGDLGAPTIFMPRVNVQDLYINTMGVEKGVYAIYDWPDTVRAYFLALDESHDRMIDVINCSPVDIVNFGDNVHAGTCDPHLFRTHVLPCYHRRVKKLHAAGKFVHAHWDGDVKPLLPFAKETGLDGIEAITPEPQGDVTLEETREALGDDMFLLDGIPAIYFDKTFPVATLEECARKVIDLFAPKLILGISDEISSTGDIERIRVVSAIVEEYNSSV